ncbi:MAG: UDP-N-acetylmuramoyl-L-alanyl-D-glutamate--2,6-diaminopimelate ligase [Candidatus Shapirobacteria bacterium]|jgi:UDP-N-acetylmuramoyl-L-alanyl-D-glutamate--2,6-diaminopimelate ligase
MFQKTKNLFLHLPKSIFYNFYYRFPSKKLTLIGVTGTDGKTTTSLLIYEILKRAGINAGVITTTGAKFGDNQEIETGLHMTSPDPSLTQKIFKKMVEAGVTHVVCEITAHALDQYRFNGCHFEISTITNTSPEHLDYFLNMEIYTKAKAKLFNRSKYAVLNKDDVSFTIIKQLIKIPFTTFGIDQKSDYQAKNIKLSEKNLKFNIDKLTITTDSNYYYQIYNILAAFAVIKHFKIDPQILSETVKSFPKTKGRREEINNDFDFKTIIDFAHTPNALKNTLSSLKKTNSGRLIAIFGATGGRDKSKRPQMGKVVSELADIAIITADDTRNEKIENINQQIIAGIKPNSILVENNLDLSQIKKTIKKNPSKFIYFNIPNRQDSFNLGVQIAQPKDIVIAFGKGHETTILHGNTEYPWSETEAFRSAFRLKNSKNDDSI